MNVIWPPYLLQLTIACPDLCVYSLATDSKTSRDRKLDLSHFCIISFLFSTSLKALALLAQFNRHFC